MKKFNLKLAATVMVCGAFLFSSCIGSFGLHSKLLNWNQGIGNKFVNELKYETIKNKSGKKEFRFFTKKSSDYNSKKRYANLLGTECKWYYLDRLMPMDKLLKVIK